MPRHNNESCGKFRRRGLASIYPRLHDRSRHGRASAGSKRGTHGTSRRTENARAPDNENPDTHHCHTPGRHGPRPAPRTGPGRRNPCDHALGTPKTRIRGARASDTLAPPRTDPCIVRPAQNTTNSGVWDSPHSRSARRRVVSLTPPSPPRSPRPRIGKTSMGTRRLGSRRRARLGKTARRTLRIPNGARPRMRQYCEPRTIRASDGHVEKTRRPRAAPAAQPIPPRRPARTVRGVWQRSSPLPWCSRNRSYLVVS